MSDTPTDDTDSNERASIDVADFVETTLASSTYKVLGEFSDSSGAGVLGTNTAGSGTPIGVQGAVPNATSDGYGLHTPHNAKVERVLEAGGAVVAGDLLTRSIVTGGSSFSLETGTTTSNDAANLVLGHESNTATSGVLGAVIGGGGKDDGSVDESNVVYDNYAVVGGGKNNHAGTDDGDATTAEHATVGGGSNNTASDFATTVGGGDNNVASGIAATVGGGAGNEAKSYGATIAGGGDWAAASGNVVSDRFGTIGGGDGNAVSAQSATVAGGGNNAASNTSATVGGGASNTASGDSSTVGGGASNTASGDNSTVGGGGRNEALESYATVAGGGPSKPSDSSASGNVIFENYGTIGGGGNNVVGTPDGDPQTAAYGTIGGGKENSTADIGATVGGGIENTANGARATVGGGYTNSSVGESATVGGGERNETRAAYATVAGGGPSDTTDSTTRDNTKNIVHDQYGTVGGGGNNQAGSPDADSTTARYATVGGGRNNTASASRSTVCGGHRNTASGDAATVPGGALGAAEDTEAFVWNDGTGYHPIPNTSSDGLSSGLAVNGEPVTGTETFSVGATGGVRFITGPSSVTYIGGGSTGWSTTSTRTAKTNFEPVDTQAVLDGVQEMDVSTWEYRSDDGAGAGVRHIGPVAEEFHDIVDVGATDSHINSINADGMLFAAVQGLADENDQLRADLEDKADRIDLLEAENEQLRDRLAAVEQHLGVDSTPDPPLADD